MTVRSAVASLLADAGCRCDERGVDEAMRHLPTNVEIADVVAARVAFGCTLADVVGAVRTEVRTRMSGQPSTPRPRRLRPPVDPLPPVPPADVAERGLASARAALAARTRDTTLDPD